MQEFQFESYINGFEGFEGAKICTLFTFLKEIGAFHPSVLAFVILLSY